MKNLRSWSQEATLQFDSPTPLQAELLALWKQVLKVDVLGLHDDFRARGGNPDSGVELIGLLEKRFRANFHVPWLLAAPTVAEQAAWLEELMAAPVDGGGATIDTVAWRCRWQESFRGVPTPPVAVKNPPAVFILSPGRSGSTLLRIMLAGHPRLFVPPEMELLLFPDMNTRTQILHDGWFDFLGLERAVMELWNCSESQAEALVAGFREQNLSIHEVYRRLQERTGGRLLVDKSPSYSASLNALQRGEVWFEQASYIHLMRHPLASIRSWASGNFDQVVHAPPRETAEAAWLFCHENILKFLSQVPVERQMSLKFEELLQDPENQSRRICDFLQLDFDPALLEPYQGNRMTEPVKGHIAGDKVFHRRSRIDPSVADSSRRRPGDGPLAQETLAMARRLGYLDEDL